jgi:hypothetical protein
VTESQLPPWDIDAGIRNAEAFFRTLPKVFPDATLFVAEGSGITKDVAAFYRQHPSANTRRPPGLSRFPLVPRYLCACSPEFFLALARLAKTTPREGLLYHLYLYQGDEQLLDWHDAFANALLVSPTVSEAAVATLAKKFGRRYGRAHFRKS